MFGNAGRLFGRRWRCSATRGDCSAKSGGTRPPLAQRAAVASSEHPELRRTRTCGAPRPVDGRLLFPQSGFDPLSRHTRSRIVGVVNPSTPQDTAGLGADILAGRPFTASAALASGHLTRYDLDRRHTRILPGVYVRRGITLDQPGRIHAVGLWTEGRAVFSGWTAAYLLGERSFSASRELRDRVEITVPRRARIRAQRGVMVRHADLPPEHSLVVGTWAVTSADRTAVDVVRRRRGEAAVRALDSMLAHTDATVDGVRRSCREAGPVHGRARVWDALDLADSGGQSPPESSLRLLLAARGYEGFRTQVVIRDADGDSILTADLADPELRIALEYDGEHHLAREQRDHDSAVILRAAAAGWLVIRVTQGMLRDPRLLLERLDAETADRRDAGRPRQVS